MVDGSEEARDRVSVGWQLCEIAPEVADYDRRGGAVVEMDEERSSFVLLRNYQGKVKELVLRDDQIDWSLAVPSSECVKTNHALVMLMIGDLARQKRVDRSQRTIKAIYELSLKLG